jgi:PAS domain S-box-containing protein
VTSSTDDSSAPLGDPMADLGLGLDPKTEIVWTSLETLQAFLDFAPGVICARDLEGNFVLRNRRFMTTFRLPDDDEAVDAEHEITPTVVPRESLDEMSTVDQGVADTGVEVRGVSELANAYGGTSTYEYTKFPLRSADGTIVAVGTIAMDVTGDREAASALRTSEERFRQMAENLDELFLLWEEGGLEMLYVSPAVERITGLDAEHFRDPASRLAIVHPDDRALALGPPAPLKEMRITKPDGAIRWLRSRTSVVQTAEGQPNRGATTMIDITEQKVAEHAAQSARLQAEQANRAKSEFLSRMSHELRTPLNAILGFGQLMEVDVELEAKQQGRAKQITKAGRHLLQLIDEVLDISRIESGQMSLSLEPVRLGDVIEDAVDLVRSSADAADVRLLIDSKHSAKHVHADRQRFTQVTLNLLSNATKYNRPGGEVRIYCETPNEGVVRLVIADTGIGISPDQRRDLFTPFARLGAEQTGIEGTGLGLTHSKRLVEAMHGQIGAESEPGVGSTFWVDLPATDGPTSRRSAEPSPRSTTGETSGAPSRTVLFIEDNLANVRLMQEIVDQRDDLEFAVAMRGGAGLELARELQPSLILLDLHLPDMDGQEVLRRLRAEPATMTIPVVIISADATASQIETLLGQGAADYITKPFSIERFLAVIDQSPPEPRPATSS